MTQTKAELLQTRNQGDIRLGDSDSSHYVGFKAPATVSSSLVWTLPAADGSSNQYLKTDGSGALSWGSDTAGMPTSGGTFTGDVTFTGDSSKNLLWDKSDGQLEFEDNAKATFGGSSDLKIYHDQSNSFIEQSGTGNLVIKDNTGSGGVRILSNDFQIKNQADNEDIAKFIENGAVQLFYDGGATPKFQTTATGATVTGTLVATAFTGALTGNVTGNCSGSAGTVTGAAQTAITSVGTLSSLVISGDLTVNGTTTTIDTTTLRVEDKNIEIGKVSSPSDTTADGGGLTLLGTTNKTWNWVNSTDAWTSSEHIEVVSGKRFIGDGSTITNVNATTLDSIDSGSFLRSDADDSASGSYSFTNSYNEFGNATGSVSNDGSWNARINLAGTSHARLDVKSVSDGIITSLSAHTGHSRGQMGTRSDHGIGFICNAAERAILTTAGSLSTTVQGTLWGASNDGAGSGLDADTLDSVQAASFVRSDADDTINASLTTRRITVQANHDIRFTTGNWTGEAAKIQHHSNYLYIQGGTNGIYLRKNDGTNAWLVDSSGHFRPNADSTFNIGSNSYRAANVYADTLYGDGSNITNLPASGGTVTATASGAISAHEAVNVNSNGTVSAVEGFTSAFGSKVEFDNAVDSYICSCYDTHNNKFLVVFREGSKLSVKIGTVSDTSISFSSATTIVSGNADYHAGIAENGSGKFCVVYRKSNGRGCTRILSSNGSSVTVGSESENMENNCNWLNVAWNPQDQRFAVVFQDAGESSRMKSVSVAITSGTSFSTSPLTEPNTSSANQQQIIYTNTTINRYVSAASDNTNSSSGTVGVYTSYINSGNNNRNTFTSQGEQLLNGESAPLAICWDSVNNKVIAFYGDSGNSTYGTVKVGTLANSNQKVEWGSANVLNSGGLYKSGSRRTNAIAFNPDTGKFACVWNEQSVSKLFFREGKVSGSSVTFDDTQEIDSSSQGYEVAIIYDTGSKRYVITYRATSDGEKGKAVIKRSASSSATTGNFIGFADAAYSNGQTATINVVGNTTTKSSLTPGKRYYLQDDGTLGLTAGTTEIVAGKSLTSTQLLISPA